MNKLLEHEQKLIAAVIDSQEIIDDYGIHEDFFHDFITRSIFKGVKEVIESGGKVNHVTVAERIKKFNIPEESVNTIPEFYGNVDFYTRELKTRAQKKKLGELALWITENKGKPVHEIIEMIETEITSISTSTKALTRAGDLLHGFIETVERRALKKESVGIKTGYTMLDKAIGGLRPGRIMIIAARTGQGKSMIALNMAANICQAGIKVGLFSCEMEKREIIERLVSLTGGIDNYKILTGEGLTQADFSVITDACGTISKMELFIDDTQYIKISELKSKIRKMARHGVQCIFIDYLTLIDPEDNRLPRHERVGLLCKLLNRISGEIKIPIVTLSQLNRNADGKEPGLADLRQSGEIEEDARIVMMLWSEGEGSKNLWCELKKNSGGPKTKFKLGYDPARMRITNEYF